MNLKKILIGTTVVLSTFTLLTVGESSQAHAQEWKARTVEEIKADFETKENDEKFYVIKSGDTLNAISEAADVKMEDLAKINKIENVDLIFPGSELTFKVNKEGKVEEVKVAQEGRTAQTYTVNQASTRTYQAQATVSSQASAPVQSSSAKEIIAQRESGGSYDARNGQYIGRYQLSASYLGGDYSPANQERVADQYVTSRYGSWEGALAFWNSNGWY